MHSIERSNLISQLKSRSGFPERLGDFGSELDGVSLAPPSYFFFALPAGLALRFSSMAAWAAARRATGTRYGEQLT
jgi:hypothetical protein